MKILFGVLLLLICFLSQARAQNDLCQNSLGLVDMQIWSEQGWHSVKPEECSSDLFIQTIAKALYELKNLPQLPFVQGVWSSHILGDSPWRFFTERVHTVQLDTNPVSSQCHISGTVVLASAGNIFQTITLCPALQWNDPLAIMSTLLHEAHHLPQEGKDSTQENPQHMHVICKSGPLAHSFSCDESFTDGGSYAVNMEFLLRLAHSSDVAAELREQAHSSALTYALSHFNQWPGGKNQGLLLVDNQKGFYFYDVKSQQLHFLTKAPEGTSFSSLRQLPVFFNAEQGDVLSFNGDDSLGSAEGTMAKAYRQMTNEERQQIIDVYYGNAFSCFLYRQKLQCEDNQGSVSVALPEEVVQFVPMLEILGGIDMVHVMGVSGTLYHVPNTKNLRTWQTSDLLATENFKGLRGVALLPAMQRFVIQQDGRVASTEDYKKFVPLKSLADFKFSKMYGPYYWASSLQEL